MQEQAEESALLQECALLHQEEFRSAFGLVDNMVRLMCEILLKKLRSQHIAHNSTFGSKIKTIVRLGGTPEKNTNLVLAVLHIFC